MPLGSRVIRFVRDVRTDRQKQRLLPPSIRSGHNNAELSCSSDHGAPQEFLQGGKAYTSSLSSSPLPLSLHFLLPTPPFPPALPTLPSLLCCEAAPLNPARGFGGALYAPPAEDSGKLGIFRASETCLVATISVLFVRTKMLQLK